MSDLEQRLVQQLKLAKLPIPTQEYRFHPSRRWRFDIAWPDVKVAVEVEGGTWVQGRHNRGSGFAADCEKYNEAAASGWIVLRFIGTNISDGSAVRLIGKVLDARR